MEGVGRQRLGWTWILYPILLFVAMSAWALSSPPGSSPDEDFHLVSAWCGLGDREGLCAPGAATVTRVVPLDLLRSPCFAFEPTISGNCPTYPGQTEETYRGNFTGYYPSGFYSVMGLFAGPSLESAVLSMRLVNSAVYALGLAALLFLARPSARAGYMLGSLITLVPLGLFSVASINPSSWAITSATLVWAGAVEFARAKKLSTRVALAALTALSLGLGVASRSDAAAYGALAIGLAWLAAVKLGRRTLIFGAIAAAVLGAILVGSLSLGSFQFIGKVPPLTPDDEAGGLFRRLKDLPNLYAGSFGTRGLGWLDTTMPWVTWILAGSVFALAIFWGLRRCGWRKAVSLLVIAVVAAAVPITLATMRHATVLAVLQPRYFLPVLILAAMIAVSEDNLEGPQLNLAQSLVIIASLSMAHAGALHANLRRYLTGSEVQEFDLNAGMEWWWKVWSPSPMVVFGIGAIAFLGAVIVVTFNSGTRADFLPAGEQAEPRRALGSD